MSDLESAQTDEEQADKSIGLGPGGVSSRTRAAEAHGAVRARTRFSMSQNVAEFRALRASVLRLWLATSPPLGGREVYQLTRFNEAIDEALAASIAHFEQANASSRSLFLGVLSHELRTPLATIMTSAKTLSQSIAPSDSPPPGIARILRGGRRTENLIDDLLEYVRSSAVACPGVCA